MDVVLFAYDRCDTCRKARAVLDRLGIDYGLIPIVETPPTEAELETLVARSGKPTRAFFNTSGQSYRALVAARGKAAVAALTDAEIRALLAADGKLVKRPILRVRDTVLVGFDEAAYLRVLR